MKLLKHLLKKRKQPKDIDEILNQVTEDLTPEDMSNERKVQHYILEHCEQVIGAAKELEEQKSEYRVVTNYLKDIQILEDLSEEETAVFQDTASNIIALNQSRDDYLTTAKKINDSQFVQMQREEDQMASAIATLQSNEMYQASVKRDMQYLEGEKMEWIYYRQEIENEQRLLRTFSYVLFGVFLMLLAIILTLRMGFAADTRMLLMCLIAAGAIGGGFLFIRMQNNSMAIKKAKVNTNHAIALLNRTKVKYVNVTNAVDYTCEKYHVKNSYELNYIWEQYIEAKRERERFERTSDDLQYFEGKMVRMLKKYNLYDAEVWVTQPQALVDKREMVEIKHNLIERRQKLRSRIEYHMDVVLEQKEEIEQLMRQIETDIPEVHEIISSVNRLCGIEES